MKQSELLDTQMNAENSQPSNSQSGKLLEREQLPNTPFWLIMDNEKHEANITMGKYKITHEPLKAEHMADAFTLAYRYLDTNKWDVVLTMALCATTDILYNTKKNKTSL